jgi:hypothetical protein
VSGRRRLGCAGAPKRRAWRCGLPVADPGAQTTPIPMALLARRCRGGRVGSAASGLSCRLPGRPSPRSSATPRKRAARLPREFHAPAGWSARSSTRVTVSSTGLALGGAGRGCVGLTAALATSRRWSAPNRVSSTWA